MKKVFSTMLSCCIFIYADATTFYSKGSLSADLPGSWNSAVDGTGSDAVTADFVSGNTFIIQENHSMGTSATWTLSGSGSLLEIESSGSLTLSHSSSMSRLTVLSGAELTVLSGVTLTITNGNPLGFDLQVSGQLSNAGSLSYGSSATGTFLAGAVYRHLYSTTAGTVPLATWNNSSTCKFSSYTSNASTPGGLAQSFGNFEWNCPSQSTNINLSGNLQTVNGTFTLSTSGTGSLRLTASASPSLSVGGDFIVNGGTLNLSSGSGTSNLYLNGDFYLAASALITESGTGSAIIHFNKSGAQSLQINGSINNDISYYVELGSTLELLSNVTINAGRSFSVSGILSSGNYSLNGSGAFQLLSGGKLVTANSSGIAATILSSGANSFSANASYELSADNAKTGFSALNITQLNHLSLSGNGVDSLDSDLGLQGVLSLSAKLYIGPYNIELTSTGSVNGAGSNTYVIADSTGRFIQQLSASSTKLFPVGTATYYHPVTISLSAASSTDEFAAGVKEGVRSNGNSGTFFSSEVVNATWFITESSSGGSNATLTFQWPSAAELSSFDRNNAFVSSFSSAWDLSSSAPASGSDPFSLSRSNISSFNLFSIGDDNSPLPVTWLNFKIDVTDGMHKLQWSTASEWNNAGFQIERSTDGTDFVYLESVPASNSSGINKYERSFIPLSQKNYYRIRQTDYDGLESYSPVLFAASPKEPGGISFLSARAILMNMEDEGMLEVFDLKGRLLKSLNLEGNKILDLAFLPPGVYVLKTDVRLFKVLIE